MPPTLKIENASYILTLDDQRRIIRDGSIVVEGQRVTGVGKAAELASVRADRVIDGRGMVVTPGLLNGHLHLSYAHAVRGIFPDDASDRLIQVFQLQSAMNEEEEYFTTLLAITELLRTGTTCFLDPGTTKYLDACLQAYQDSGCRVIVGEGITDIPEARKLPVYPTDVALGRIEQNVRAYDRRLDGRVRAWAMPFSTYSCTTELLVGAKRLADMYGTGLTIHHSSSKGRRDAYLTKYGVSPTAYLEQIGMLGPNVLLAHATGVDETDMDCIARSGASVAMCPGSVIKEGGGIRENSRLPEFLDRGVNVALGNDSANSSNYLDTVRTMNLAAVLYKDAYQDATLIPGEVAVELATITGAKALGMADEAGSIEVGKKADLVLFDTRRAEWRALFNPVNNLVYSADGQSVHTVIVDGRVVVEDFKALYTDERALGLKVQELGERFLARVGVTPSPGRWPVI